MCLLLPGPGKTPMEVNVVKLSLSSARMTKDSYFIIGLNFAQEFPDV